MSCCGWSRRDNVESDDTRIQCDCLNPATVDAWTSTLPLKRLALFHQPQHRSTVGWVFFLAQVMCAVGFGVILIYAWQSSKSAEYVSPSKSSSAYCSPVSPASQEIWLSSEGHWSSSVDFKYNRGLLKFYIPAGYSKGADKWKEARQYFASKLLSLKSKFATANYVETLMYLTTYELTHAETNIIMRFAGETIYLFPKTWITGVGVNGLAFKLMNDSIYYPFNLGNTYNSSASTTTTTSTTTSTTNSSSSTKLTSNSTSSGSLPGGPSSSSSSSTTLSYTDFSSCGSGSSIEIVTQGAILFTFNRTEFKKCHIWGYTANDSTDDSTTLTLQADFRTWWVAAAVNMGIINKSQFDQVSLKYSEFTASMNHDPKVEDMNPFICTDNSSCGTIHWDKIAGRWLSFFPVVEHKCKFLGGSGCGGQTCNCGSTGFSDCDKGPFYFRFTGGVVTPSKDGYFANATRPFQWTWYFNTEVFFRINPYSRTGSFPNCSSGELLPDAAYNALAADSSEVDSSLTVLYECTPGNYDSWVSAISTAYGAMASISTVLYAIVAFLLIRVLNLKGTVTVFKAMIQNALKTMSETQKVDHRVRLSVHSEAVTEIAPSVAEIETKVASERGETKPIEVGVLAPAPVTPTRTPPGSRTPRKETLDPGQERLLELMKTLPRSRKNSSQQ